MPAGQAVDALLADGRFATWLSDQPPSTWDNANVLPRGFLPDVLVYDPSAAGGYPNCRYLTDDVVDPLVAMVTMGRVCTEGVGPRASGGRDRPGCRIQGYHGLPG